MFLLANHLAVHPDTHILAIPLASNMVPFFREGYFSFYEEMLVSMVLLENDSVTLHKEVDSGFVITQESSCGLIIKVFVGLKPEFYSTHFQRENHVDGKGSHFTGLQVERITANTFHQGAFQIKTFHLVEIDGVSVHLEAVFALYLIWSCDFCRQDAMIFKEAVAVLFHMLPQALSIALSISNYLGFYVFGNALIFFESSLRISYGVVAFTTGHKTESDHRRNKKLFHLVSPNNAVMIQSIYKKNTPYGSISYKNMILIKIYL